MRYALTDAEWRLIEPVLPCKPRGVPRVDDRRILNGIFWVLRSGAPGRDSPERYVVPTRLATTGSCGGDVRASGTVSLLPSRIEKMLTFA
jgi:transposase